MAARGARCLMKLAERPAIDLTGDGMGRAIAPPTLPTSSEMVRSAVHVITGCAAPGARWAKWLPVSTTDEGVCKTGCPPTGSTTG